MGLNLTDEQIAASPCAVCGHAREAHYRRPPRAKHGGPYPCLRDDCSCVDFDSRCSGVTDGRRCSAAHGACQTHPLLRSVG